MGIFSFRENWRSLQRSKAEIAALEAKTGSDAKKKKINRAIDDQQQISRRAFIQMLAGGTITAVGAGTAIGITIQKLTAEPEFDYSRKPSVPMTPIVQLNLSASNEIERMVELQGYWKKTSLQAIERFRASDPRVGLLINFMREKARYSVPVGPVMTQSIGTKGDETEKLLNDPQSFEVVYMPEKYAARMAAPILTEGDGTMRIATNFRLQEWLGIMFLHELSHEYDQKVNGENTRNKDEYFAGEVRAHLLEMALLKSWDPKSYEQLIKRGVPLFNGIKKGANIETMIRLIKSLYPLTPEYVSEKESDLGIASCLMAIAFEDARANGAKDKDLEQVYKDMLRNFGGGDRAKR